MRYRSNRTGRVTRGRALLALLLLVGCADQARRDADALSAGAADATNFFGQLCLMTLGDRSALEARIAHASAPMVPAPAPPRRAAWTTVSPHAAALRIEVDDVQSCAVDVATADGAAVRRYLLAMLDRLYGENGFRYRLVGDEVDRAAGLRRQEYLIRLPSQQSATIGVASGLGAPSAARLSFAYSGQAY